MATYKAYFYNSGHANRFISMLPEDSKVVKVKSDSPSRPVAMFVETVLEPEHLQTIGDVYKIENLTKANVDKQAITDPLAFGR